MASGLAAWRRRRCCALLPGGASGEFAFDAVQQLMVGVAERADSLALELGGDGGQVNADGRGIGKGPLRLVRICIEGARDRAVIAECAQRLLGHGIDHAGATSR